MCQKIRNYSFLTFSIASQQQIAVFGIRTYNWSAFVKVYFGRYFLTGIFCPGTFCSVYIVPGMYCLCLARRVSISTRAPVQSLTIGNQTRTHTYIISHSSLWRTPVTEIWYLFYRTGRVNLMSECMTEINLWSGWDSNQQPLISILPLSNRVFF